MPVVYIIARCPIRNFLSSCLTALALALLIVSLPLPVHANSVPIFFIPNPDANAGLSADATPKSPGTEAHFQVATPELAAAFTPESVQIALGDRWIAMRFPGARPVVPEGVIPEGHVHIIRGAEEGRARTAMLPAQRVIRYRQLYPGIDLLFLGGAGGLKAEWYVAPGRSPGQIEVDYDGADEVWIAEDGSLMVRAGQATFRESAPEVYQESAEGQRIPVEAHFELRSAGRAGFWIGDYDPERELVIDPAVSYATYLSGSGIGAVTGVGVDGAGNLYAAGWTEALNFPIAGAMQPSNAGSVDAFVVKLNPSGNTLLYATYIGGSGDDRVLGMAVDGSNQVALAGYTGSANFPLQSAARSTFLGGREAFALKLNAAGSALVFSTYLGGANWEQATAVAVDASGNTFVAGDTRSADFTVVNPLQATLGGLTDAFLVKLSTAGTILYSGLAGGSLDEHAGAVAVDSTGNAYLAGSTLSQNFPVASPIQGASAGGMDGFVQKIRTSPSPQLLYSTYLGGSGGNASAPEQINGAAVDASGNVYLAGVTSSSNFPTVAALQPTFNGFRDAFITKINAAGTIRLYSTYFGATGFDWANAIAVDGAGNAYVAGYTSSVGFAQVNAVQSGFAGAYDAFISKLSPNGGTLSFSTMYGGTGADLANAIAVDGDQNIFVGGQTGSPDFPVAAALQSSNSAGITGWLARFGETAPPSDVPSVVSATRNNIGGGTYEITAVYSHTAGAASLTEVELLLSPTGGIEFACYLTYDAGQNQITLAKNVTSSGGTSLTPGSGTVQNDQCTLNGAGTSVDVDGATLTLVASLTLESGFPGNPSVYLRASDNAASTGWESFSLASVPSADSVSPSAGEAAEQVFTFVFSDSQSAANITGFSILINSSFTNANGCYVTYDPGNGNIYLLWDGASGSNPRPLGATSTIYNSQCLIGPASVELQGHNLIFTVSIQFFAAFNGPKNIYMFAVADGGATNSGWIQRGTFSSKAGGVPVAESVTPDSGTGPNQAFTFTVSDIGGEEFITGVAMVVAPTFNLNNACSIVFDRGTNTLSLAYDTAGAGASSLPVGSTGSVSNSQCVLYGSGSGVTYTDTEVRVTVNLAFGGGFAGAKYLYLLGAEAGVNSGWSEVGSWNVTGNAPSVSGITPTSGGGQDQTFVVTVADEFSAVNISRVDMWFASDKNCLVVLDLTASLVGLYDNTGTILSTKPLGSSATLQNGQCEVGYTFYTTAGVSLSFSVTMRFKVPQFAGTTSVYGKAYTPAAESAYTLMGSWMVPGSPPAIESVTPLNGSGGAPSFTVKVTDTVSSAYVSQIDLLITPSAFSNACHVRLDRTTNLIGLFSNDHINMGTKPIGSSSTLENSQCAIGFTTQSDNGKTATFTVNVVFKPGFTGTKAVWTYGATPWANTGWLSMGTWIVP